MLVLEAGSSHFISQLEKRVVTECGAVLENRAGGGGRVRNTAHSIWYLYLVYSAPGRSFV